MELQNFHAYINNKNGMKNKNPKQFVKLQMYTEKLKVER